MGEQQALTDEEIEIALAAKLRPRVPFSREELDDVREMMAQWKYEQRRREDFRKRWPLVFAVISILGTIATVGISVVVNFVQGGGRH